MQKEQKKERIRERINTVASERGYRVNEDVVALIIKGLFKRWEKYGVCYCPCRVVSSEDEKFNKSIICPCFFLDKEIEESGKCHCGLYLRR